AHGPGRRRWPLSGPPGYPPAQSTVPDRQGQDRVLANGHGDAFGPSPAVLDDQQGDHHRQPVDRAERRCRALEDRGHCLHFAPSAAEVHRQAAEWFWDQEVFDFVAMHLPWTNQHSLRTYVLAWELKAAGLDWRQAVLSRCLTGAALSVAKLKADPSFGSEEERVRAFVAAGLGCRATYFNYAKKLQLQKGPPQIKLTHASPPEAVKSKEDYLDTLRRRFGPLGKG